ncbi:MAG: SdpI family protein [Dehalococcoidia bacterium]
MSPDFAVELRTGLPWLLGTGALFIVLGWGMHYVGPNHWYGVRIPATFADERVWRDTNRRSGRLLMLVGAGTLAIGLWAFTAPSLAPYVVAWLLGGILAMAVDAFRYAARRLRHYRALDASGEERAR